MKITKDMVREMFAGLPVQDRHDIVGFLHAHADGRRNTAGHRLPKAAAARVAAFMAAAGLPEDAYELQKETYGFVPVRVDMGRAESRAFARAVAASGLSGPRFAKLALAADADAAEAMAEYFDEAADRGPETAEDGEPAIPDVIGCVVSAARNFLNSLDCRLRSVGEYSGTWSQLEEDIGDPYDLHPALNGDIDVGEMTNCIVEMRQCAFGDGRLPSLAAIETALWYLDLCPATPRLLADVLADGSPALASDVERMFYALGRENTPVVAARYASAGETLPDFSLLLTDRPCDQVYYADGPMNGYVSGYAGQVSAGYGPKTAALLCFGAAPVARSGAAPLLAASDPEKFWGYVRELLLAWISYGAETCGIEGKIDIVFHPWSRVGLSVAGENVVDGMAYAIGSDNHARSAALMQCVGGNFDERGDEHVYDPDDVDYDALAKQFANTAATAVFGFAVTPRFPGDDRLFNIAPQSQIRLRVVDDSGDSDVKGAMGVKDLPLEWAALIHGFKSDKPGSVERLRAMFDDGWFLRRCVAATAANGFPCDELANHADEPVCRTPSPLGFVRGLTKSLRAFAGPGESVVATVAKGPVAGSPGYGTNVDSAHSPKKIVTAVYTGMTVEDGVRFDGVADDDQEYFAVPDAVKCDIRCDSTRAYNSILVERPDTMTAVTRFIDLLNRRPDLMLKCEPRKKGDTRRRTAWAVFETNFDAAEVCRKIDTLLSSCDSSRAAISSMFVDAVVKGVKTPFLRFFDSVDRTPDDRDNLRAAFAACATSANPELSDGVRVGCLVRDAVPAEAESSRTSYASDFGRRARVSFAADAYGRLILFVAVDGDMANIARFRYRVSCEAPFLGAFTRSMWTAYRQCSGPDDAIVREPDWIDLAKRRAAVFEAAFRRCPPPRVETPPKGGFTCLMLKPRDCYAVDKPYPKSVYAEAVGTVAAEPGRVCVPGFVDVVQ